MKTLLAVAALLCLSLSVPRTALAQNATTVSCSTVLDGGTTVETCGPITTTLQPFSAACCIQVPGVGGGSAGFTGAVQYSPDGVSFGPAADGGAETQITLGQNSGGQNCVTFDKSPYNPYKAVQIVGTATAEVDGGQGSLNCTFGVIQAQTIHATRNSAAKPPAKK